MNWQKAAEEVFAEVGSLELPIKVSDALSQSNSPLYIACSGGADSLFALLWFWAYSKTGGISRPLTVLHFNHALRGNASDEDERFVAFVAKELGLPFASGRADWEKTVADVSESDARIKRLQFFESTVVCEEGNFASIVTGHHADDIAETMLMRLSRGSGLQGLCAPREISRCSPRIQFLRPFLGLSRVQIREALQASGVAWREDESNAGDDFYRNRLRSSVIPEWEAASDRPVFPGVVRSRMLLEEDFDALESFEAEAWTRIRNPDSPCELNRENFAKIPKAIQRRLLLRWISENCRNVVATAQVVDETLSCLAIGRIFSFNLSPNWSIRGDATHLAVIYKKPLKRVNWTEFVLTPGVFAFMPDGAKIGIQRVQVTPNLLAELRTSSSETNHSTVVISVPEKQLPRIFVRKRQPGDAFIPLGKSSPKKLKNLLIERKIKQERRDSLPVFATETDEILWVPGLPPSAKHLVSEKSECALRLTYQ